MVKIFARLAMLSMGTAFCATTLTNAQGSAARATASAHAVPLNADGWTFKPGTVEFLSSAPAIAGITPQGPALKITARTGGAIVAKNIDFAEGVIDFDIQPSDSNFASFYF